jgi:hypothetical protein
MSASSLACPSHSIAIVMSAEGRFLECLNCRLRVRFTAGARYEVIAKQFDSHVCGSAISSVPRLVGGTSVGIDACTRSTRDKGDTHAEEKRKRFE